MSSISRPATAGWSHSLFVLRDAQVVACGNAEHNKIPGASLVPAPVKALKGLPVTRVCSYNEHNLILTAPCGPSGPFRAGAGWR